MSKQALIDPNEPRESGYRVAQVEDKTFEVALPLFWTPCEDDVVADQFWYNPANQLIKPYLPPPPSAEDNKNTAVNLLTQTDWTTIPDVADSALSNPYLTNQAEFITFRNEVRPIAINPVAGNLTWPQTPVATWSN